MRPGRSWPLRILCCVRCIAGTWRAAGSILSTLVGVTDRAASVIHHGKPNRCVPVTRLREQRSVENARRTTWGHLVQVLNSFLEACSASSVYHFTHVAWKSKALCVITAAMTRCGGGARSEAEEQCPNGKSIQRQYGILQGYRIDDSIL